MPVRSRPIRSNRRSKPITRNRRSKPITSNRRSKPRGGPIHITHPGTFSDYGYKTSNSAETRRRSLARVANAKGAGMVVRRLNALHVLTRNRSPVISRKFHHDMKWVQRTYGTNRPKKSRKVSRRRRVAGGDR